MHKEPPKISLMFKVSLTLTLLLNIVFIVWYLVGGYLTKQKADKTTTTGSSWHEEKKALFKVLPADTGAIVFLGNSIIEQYPLEEYFGTCKVKNRGISGNVLSALIDRADETVANKPAVVVVEGVVNDFFDGKQPKIVFEDFKRLVQRIKIQSPQSVVFVLAALPTKRFMPKIKEYNALLMQYCIAEKLSYVDIFTPFLKNGTQTTNIDLTTDGLHLNANGYALLTALLQPHLKNYFEKSRTRS